MGILPQPSWFPIPREGLPPTHLITTAAALRLGEILHLRTHNYLQSGLSSLLRSSFKDVLHGRAFLFKGMNFIQSSKDAFPATCASCLCFFGGNNSNKDFGGKEKSYLESSSRNSLNGRKWTNILLAINVLVYVAQIATQGKLIIWGAKINSFIDRGQLWRLATSSFLHANIGHLMVNCYSLNSVGPIMENTTGPRRFLAVYFTSAIASSAMSYWFCKAPAVGASGAIFGLVGSFAVFVLRHRSLVRGGKEELRHIAQVIALNMIIGLLSKGIDNWGHLGGLLGGAAMSWLLGPAWRYESRSNDGRSVFADRAPIFYLINRKRTAG
ncbi:hypothetical protein NE237_024220 [Protea cynaroides]|uniref:Peptidase S54 rhomboid domain-containing protein n=1 Tax=Protea cynaroides TaxID=273540 RepID=A0A9Q0HCX5_9MAGN|nr:hypothetical protein NE237_024220 [Protea cynaroides]